MKNILTAAQNLWQNTGKPYIRTYKKGGYTLMRIHPIYIEYMT